MPASAIEFHQTLSDEETKTSVRVQLDAQDEQPVGIAVGGDDPSWFSIDEAQELHHNIGRALAEHESAT